MAILIDGYNLLHVTDVFSDAVGPGSIEKLHASFLNFLASALDPADVPHTTVVFDAKGRHSGSRRSFRYGDITVHYAARHEDADTVLAELIAKHTSPRRLIVVSSDHQVQRAARRRRAQPIDSDVWYADLLRRRRARQKTSHPPHDSKPPTPISEIDAASWIAQFTDDLAQELAAELPSPSDSTEAPGKSPPPNASLAVPEADPVADPFPQSYLEQIQREFLSEGSKVPPPKSRPGKASKKRPKRRRS